jgi:C1A family cysteine protease
MSAYRLTPGWKPDVPDHRDKVYAAAPFVALPPSTDLRAKMPPVYNQGSLGSCTANAIGGAIEYLHEKDGLGNLMPSRLFIYYNERLKEGNVKIDSGAQIRTGIKSVNAQGACDEETWPYQIEKFTRKPNNRAYVVATKHKAIQYQRLTRLHDFKAHLAQGIPVVFGFAVSESFESEAVAQSGIAAMPTPNEKMVGGHAVLAVGYDDATQMLLVRNSWGPEWGLGGYFWLPYGFITEGLADDFWVIEVVK